MTISKLSLSWYSQTSDPLTTSLALHLHAFLLPPQSHSKHACLDTSPSVSLAAITLPSVLDISCDNHRATATELAATMSQNQSSSLATSPPDQKLDQQARLSDPDSPGEETLMAEFSKFLHDSPEGVEYFTDSPQAGTRPEAIPTAQEADEDDPSSFFSSTMFHTLPTNNEADHASSSPLSSAMSSPSILLDSPIQAPQHTPQKITDAAVPSSILRTPRISSSPLPSPDDESTPARFLTYTASASKKRKSIHFADEEEKESTSNRKNNDNDDTRSVASSRFSTASGASWLSSSSAAPSSAAC